MDDEPHPRDSAPSGDDSRELVERAQTRDPGAIDALLERHLPALRAYVRMRAGPLVIRRESSDDLVQSVCVDLLEDLGDFDYRGEVEFRHWLFQRAFHKILERRDYYTAQKRDVRREQPADSRAEVSRLEGYLSFCTPSREAIQRETLARVEAAIDALPEDYRTAIALHRLVGLTAREIGAQMNRSEGAARNLIYRGLARIGLALAEGERS